MDASVMAAVITGMGVVGSAAISYFITRSKNKKDVTIKEHDVNARLAEQLSDEQKELRKEMRDEIRQLRDDMNMWRDRSFKLEDRVRSQEVEIQKWQEEVRIWQARAAHLETENASLRDQINEMSAKLKRMYEKEN